jgi:hypothetical protein
MVDRTKLTTKDEQDLFERLVFRVLDVDHKDYQAAMDGFVAICRQADAARAVVEAPEIEWCDEHAHPAAPEVEDALAYSRALPIWRIVS